MLANNKKKESIDFGINRWIKTVVFFSFSVLNILQSLFVGLLCVVASFLPAVEVLTKENIVEPMRDIRRALLEADVSEFVN